MSKHTNGPWNMGKNVKGDFGVWATQQWFNIFDSSAPGIDAEANAMLCAAAPEMLEALKEALEQIEYLSANLLPRKQQFTYPTTSKCKQTISDLIAKTEGKEMQEND